MFWQMIEIIDTHVHIWNPQRVRYNWLDAAPAVLNRNWDLAELEPERKAAGVVGGVLVQAGGNVADTELMLEAARHSSWIKGVVGWLPLEHPDQAQQMLDLYLQDPLFKGVRHQIHDEADPKWLLQPGVLESLAYLAEKKIPYDVVGIHPEHLETALEVAVRVPGLKMVLDHMNQPPIASGERFGLWGELMKAAAAHQQFYVKISGLGTTSGRFFTWTAADIEPYLGFILERFGVARCFCGGDWPVATLAGSYTNAWSNYREALENLLSEKHQQQVLHDNAIAFYSLY